MGVYNGSPSARHCKRLFDPTCEMKQWERSVSKVTEY